MNTVKENVRNATAALDDKLIPILGPATRGPFGLDERDDPHPGIAELLCPVCHHAMGRHELHADPSSHHTYLRCPELGTEFAIERHEHEDGPGTLAAPVLS